LNMMSKSQLSGITFIHLLGILVCNMDETQQTQHVSALHV
jgi:hypothetical protein